MYNLKESSVGGDVFSCQPEDRQEEIRRKHAISSTGRVHSEETRRKMSQSAKGVNKSKTQVEKHKAALKSKHRHWYTNGLPGQENNKCIPEGDPIPEGFYLGRTYSEEQKKHCGEVNLHKVPWNKGLTKDTDERVAKYGESIHLKKKD